MKRELENLDVSEGARLSITLEAARVGAPQRVYDEADARDVSSEKYPAREHALKVVKELGADTGLIFLPGKPTLFYEDSDMSPEFRQRKYFFYMSGVNLPDCAVTYDIAKATLILWIPYVEPRQALYFGSPPDPEEAKRIYDVDEVRFTDDLSDFLHTHLSTHRIYVLHPLSLPESVNRSVSRFGSSIDAFSLLPAMNRARVIKGAHEVALIRRACHISAMGHRLIAERLLDLSNERDVHAIFSAASIARGAPAMAYPVIAGAGENGATLHYIENNADLAGNELMVVDAGCEYEGYASDITRTLPIGGRFKGKAAEVHAVVQGMQDACIAAAKPGKPFYELHVLAADIALDGLLNLGILKGDREKIRKQGTVSAFFPHGLGHHVGLEVHDVSGDVSLMGIPTRRTWGVGKDRKRSHMSPMNMAALVDPEEMRSRPSAPLQPGMVVTIEPGIYFCRPYIEGYFLEKPEHARFIDTRVLDKYYSVGGVRIEDVILITEGGNDNLSWRAPKGKELEDVINGGSGLF